MKLLRRLLTLGWKWALFYFTYFLLLPSKDVTLMTGIPAAILDHEVIHGEEERQKEVGSLMIFWNHSISNLGFPGGSASKESACSTGGLGLIPGLRRSPGEGTAQHSGLENSRDCIAHGSQRVAHSWAAFTISNLQKKIKLINFYLF